MAVTAKIQEILSKTISRRSYNENLDRKSATKILIPRGIFSATEPQAGYSVENPNNYDSGKSHDIEKERTFEECIRYLSRLKWALTYDSRDRYGFEQSVSGDDSDFNNCSALNPDSRQCMLPVCEEAMKKEFGCALRFHAEEDEQSCDVMPFRTTLLQTRQPWHIVRSLV